MGGRRPTRLLLVAVAISVAACSERQTEAPTAPDFKRTASTCDLNAISDLVKTEFGASSQESSIATDMKQSGEGTDQATYDGYSLLRSIETKYQTQTAGNPPSTSTASALAVALLQCMNIGGASVPQQSVFDAALGFTGAFAVRAFGTTADYLTVTSHDGEWVLEPPGAGSGSTSWQDISVLTTGITDPRIASTLLVYGQRITDASFGNDPAQSSIFDWSTLPVASFDLTKGGVIVGQCTVTSNYLQHNAKSNNPEVLGFIRPSCFTQTAMNTEHEPRSFAQRLLRFFAPAPAFATAAATSTGTGGSKGALSPFVVVDPQKLVLDPTFTWKKSGNVVNQPFSPTVGYNLETKGGSPFLQDYVLVWLEATNNQGAPVAMCNNWAYTNTKGQVAFPAAYLNKAGGYTITTRSSSTVSKPLAGQDAIPLVPASDPLVSPLINVKNDVTQNGPMGCTTFVPSYDGSGEILNVPEAPGPNGFVP